MAATGLPKQVVVLQVGKPEEHSFTLVRVYDSLVELKDLKGRKAVFKRINGWGIGRYDGWRIEPKMFEKHFKLRLKEWL